MADVTTYRRCVQAYATTTGVHNVGDVRASSDAVVTANPNYWVAFVDADFTGVKAKWH